MESIQMIIKMMVFVAISLPLGIIDLVFGVIWLLGTTFRRYSLDVICKMSRWFNDDEEDEMDLQEAFADFHGHITDGYDHWRDYALEKLK